MDCDGLGLATGDLEDLPDCPRLPSPTISEYEELFRHYHPYGTPAAATPAGSSGDASRSAGGRSGEPTPTPACLEKGAPEAQRGAIAEDPQPVDWTAERLKIPIPRKSLEEQEVNLKRGDGVCGAKGSCSCM